MVEEALLNTLTDYGALGLFAGFLIYLYLGMQKRMDSLVEKFQDQLDKINTNYDDRIEKMRERYEVVITGLRTEASDVQKDLIALRERTHEEVVEQINDNARKLNTALEKLDLGLGEMRKHYEESRLREIARKASSGEG
jgi:DNA anti-recombination protein RmuC